MTEVGSEVLPNIPGATLNNPVTNITQANKSRDHHGVRGLHFARQENRDNANLSFHVKNIIIEGSPARLRVYDGEKVTARSDVGFSSRNHVKAAAERAKRRAVRV
jgi:hypothetical protein